MATAPLVIAGGWRSRSKHQALIVGCDKYSAGPPLTRAVADAKAVASRLRSYGYDVTETYDQTIASVEQATQSFLGALGPDSMAFLFFACHGVQIHGRNVLLASDSEVTSGTALRRTAIDLPKLYERIEARKPERTVVILDACRENVFDDEIPDVRSGIGSGRVPPDFYIGYSAGYGESALDRLSPADPDPNGVFTRSFLANLNGGAALGAILERTQAEVIRSAASVRRKQHPATYDQIAGSFTIRGERPRVDSSGSVRAQAAGIVIDPTTQALMIGVDDYKHLPPLKTPPADMAALQNTFAAIGVKSDIVLNPTTNDIGFALQRLARSGSKTLILYVAAYGAYHNGDGILFLRDSRQAFRSPTEWAPFNDDPANVLTLEQITRALMGPGSPSDRQLIMFIDSNLLFMGETDKKGFIDRLALHPSHAGLDNLAIFYAAGFEKMALDNAGQGHSPYAIALRNGLSRPGMTMQELGDFLSEEVLGMTEGVQEPALFAHPDMLCRQLTRLVREEPKVQLGGPIRINDPGSAAGSIAPDDFDWTPECPTGSLR